MNLTALSAGLFFLAVACPIGAQDASATPTPLAELITEAAKNNPRVLAAEHTWRAATHIRKQVATLPNPQFTVQEFSVGSPKPFAGFNTSNFAYIGIGASQELPYPGKLRLKGDVADGDAAVQRARIGVVQSSVEDDIKAAYLQLAYL